MSEITDDAAGAVRRTLRPGPNRCRDCVDEPDGPCPMCAVALYGTAGARVYLDARAERDALLPRLAELAEQAGKVRTAEWLRTCATLPVSEWPPAPAYKGPMVPAAELDLALWLHAEALWFLEMKHDEIRMLHRQWFGARKTAHERAAERDALQARIDAALAKLQQSLKPSAVVCDEAIAALQGDQPTEPEKPFGIRLAEASMFEARRLATEPTGEADRG